MNIKRLSELRQEYDVLKNRERGYDAKAARQAWNKYMRAIDEMGLTLAGAEQQTWEYMCEQD